MPAITDAIFDSILRPQRGTISAAHARYIQSLDFTKAVKDRAEVLSYKAQDGLLSDSEQYELDTYLSADAFLMILQAKARTALRESSKASKTAPLRVAAKRRTSSRARSAAR
jgi:hypothetical protein